jgi:hypothetical protein
MEIRFCGSDLQSDEIGNLWTRLSNNPCLAASVTYENHYLVELSVQLRFHYGKDAAV